MDSRSLMHAYQRELRLPLTQIFYIDSSGACSAFETSEFHRAVVHCAEPKRKHV